MTMVLFRLPLALLGALAACQAPPAEPTATRGEAPVYVALPLRNLTAEPDAPRRVATALQRVLEARGARFVRAADLDGYLRRKRIRYTDSIQSEDARKLAEETGATHVILGTLVAWETAPTPRVDVTLRLFDARTGEKVQSSVLALRGEDFRGLLALGAITDMDLLLDEVVVRAADGFDARGAPLGRVEDPGWAVDRFAGIQQIYAAPEFDMADVGSVAILPLENRSGHTDVGVLVADLLAHTLYRDAGVRVTESAELRGLLLRERVRFLRELDLATLARMGQSAGVRYLVLGSVERFDERVYVGALQVPEVEFSIRFVDVRTLATVAAASVRRRGDDYTHWLGLGTVHDSTSLALRALREIVAGLHGVHA